MNVSINELPLPRKHLMGIIAYLVNQILFVQVNVNMLQLH